MIRFYGLGKNGIDRADIQLDPHVPADIGAGSFTIELWIRRDPLAELVPGPCNPTGDGWIAGNVILDRDVRGTAMHGEFGLSLVGGRLAFGLTRGGQAVGLCGTATVASGWNHVAVTRDGSSGAIAMYLKGEVDGTATGPVGDVSFANGAQGDPRIRSWSSAPRSSTSAASTRPSPAGSTSSGCRRPCATPRPSPAIVPFEVDADTAALYHFDDGDGATVTDARGMSPGQLRIGLDDNGSTVPTWASATPFLN
ncbi:MAG: LamG domain-containing protein [Kofleriaceae bacterium]|nr:LamG domain-containing protein [Kofleriaceae bacterium]